MICRTSKPAGRKNKVLFINAINEVVRKNAQSFLEDDHIKKIADAYEQFGDVQYFAKAASYDEIAAQEFNLNINRYVEREVGPGDDRSLSEHYSAWHTSSNDVRNAIGKVRELLGGDLS